MEGQIHDQTISVLIDLGPNYSYVIAVLVNKCNLFKELHEEAWLVLLAIGTESKNNHWVRSCALELRNMGTKSHLNVLPLGEYVILLGMNWLYLHRTKVYFFKKEIECLDG